MTPTRSLASSSQVSETEKGVRGGEVVTRESDRWPPQLRSSTQPTETTSRGTEQGEWST